MRISRFRIIVEECCTIFALVPLCLAFGIAGSIGDWFRHERKQVADAMPSTVHSDGAAQSMGAAGRTLP